jgi:hypothetical protein
MSERVKAIVARARRLQDFRYIFPELIEAIEALAEEVDALRDRVATLEPVQPPAPAPLAGYPPLYIGSARALALADAVRTFLDETGFRYATPPPAPFNALRDALEKFEKGKAT